MPSAVKPIRCTFASAFVSFSSFATSTPFSRICCAIIPSWALTTLMTLLWNFACSAAILAMLLSCRVCSSFAAYCCHWSCQLSRVARALSVPRGTPHFAWTSASVNVVST